MIKGNTAVKCIGFSGALSCRAVRCVVFRLLSFGLLWGGAVRMRPAKLVEPDVEL